MPKPGIPESFKVLIKELQSLCLDIRALDENMNEIHLKDSSEEEDESSIGISVKDDASYIDMDLNDDDDFDDDAAESDEADDYDDDLLEDDAEDDLDDELEDDLEDEFDTDLEDGKGDFVDDLDLL